MLSFFRINDPLRLIGVFIILLLIRISFFTNAELIMIPEIKWMLLGEKIANGDLLYKKVWDTTAPLSALFYAFVHFLFGKSVIAYRIISALLVLFYAYYYSKILIKNNVYFEKTYVPGVVLAILCCIFFDFFTLTPPLLGLGFILISLDYLFKLLEKGLYDNQYYNVGFLIGLSALFYLPYAIFMLFVMVGMFFYSSTSLRKYLLTILGFSFPFLIVFIFYSLYYGLEELYYMYLISFLTIEKTIYIGIKDQMIVMLIPVLFLVLAMGKIFVAPRFSNYQQKTQQLMFLYLIASVLSYVFIVEFSPYHLILSLPGFTFFITHYFLLIRKKLLSELAFVLFILSIPILNLGIFYGVFGKNYFGMNALIAKEASTFSNKKILVLGEDLSVYRDNNLATPYLNWNLAKNHFDNLEFYEVLIAAYDNFENDLPEVIIDKSKSIKPFFDKAPLLSKQYENCGESTYCLKK